MTRRARWTTIALLVSGGMLGLTTAAVAGGTELTRRKDDLEVTVDSRWAAYFNQLLGEPLLQIKDFAC